MKTAVRDEALFMGLDIGTSGVKAILISASGDVRATATTPLTMQTPHPGWAEQDPESWWQATVTCVRSLLQTAPNANIASIGISGQMHSSVFLDSAGEVIRPALLWCDGRTTKQCADITRSAGGENNLRSWVSNPALEGFTLPKVLWLRDEEPASFARLSKVLLAKDFIRYRLTGTIATEPSDASGTLMFDPARLRWSDEMLHAVSISNDLLPDVGDSAQVLGQVSQEASSLTGLRVGIPVVGGGADNACGAAGVGAVAAGDVVASWGTSGTVLAPTAQPLVDPLLRAHTFCHVAPQTWYVMGVVLSAGGALEWYRENFAADSGDNEHTLRDLDAEAERVPAGADGVTFLPYLQGERTPHRNATLRGAFLGLSLAHTRAHLTRAVLEGVCFAMNDSLSIMKQLGLMPRELLLTGGGSKSELIRRLQADIFGVPVTTVNREEGAAYGAALLAAVGVDAFPDIASAARATLTRAPLQDPDAESQQRYEQLYARFTSLYPAVQNIN